MESQLTKKRKERTPVQSQSKKQTANHAQPSTSTSTASSIISLLASMMSSQRHRNPSISSASSASSSSTLNRAQPQEKRTGFPIGEHDLDGVKFGKFRNVVEADVILIDGEEARTNISEQEAFGIFVECP